MQVQEGKNSLVSNQMQLKEGINNIVFNKMRNDSILL